MKDHFEYHLELFQRFDETLAAFLEKTPDHDPQSCAEALALLEETRTAMAQREDYPELGQRLLSRVVAHFPAFTPHVQRDLFWFFGGDCLHYLGDDEIEKFQRLEERYFDSDEQADYADLRAQVFGLH